jgi:hypothetical protein
MKKVYQHFPPLFSGRFRIASMLSISFLIMLLVQASGASARSISQNPVYYACANYSTGKIYVIQQNGKCKPGYTMIQWDQVGPQGPQGSQGPQGPQGPAGVSQGYFAFNGQVQISYGGWIRVVVTAPVAGGTYIVTGTETVLVDTNDEVSCIISSNTGFYGHYYGTAGPMSNPQYSTITVTDTLSVVGGEQIELLCYDYNLDPNTFSSQAGISAIQLNAVGSNAPPMRHKPALPPLPHH